MLESVRRYVEHLDRVHINLLETSLVKDKNTDDASLQDFQKELNNVRELIKNREQELKVKENEEKKFYSNFKDLVNKRNKLTEKIQSLDANIAREEEKLKGHEQRLNSVNIDRAKAIAELEGLQKELARLCSC